ncbi:MAG: exodeoxyribonuclease III [Spirochaetes bacterium]|nr:exodeoxyribonuclease III [Spirochaetota bacterium]
MIISSFNCNSIRARLPVLEKWIKEVSPDVLALQETKVSNGEFPEDIITSLGYNSLFMGEKNYNGVAVLSKKKIGEVYYGFDGAGEDEGSRLIAVKTGKLHIVNTYIPQGSSPDSDKFQYKLDWFKRIGLFFDKRYSKDDLLIWLGDFNVAPTPLDVHNPKRLIGSIGYHPDEHRELALVTEWGFTDLYRKLNPEGGHYTFWDYRVKDGVAKGLGWRVDHIWGTSAVEKKLVRSWIDISPRLMERPSDHTPILVELKI